MNLQKERTSFFVFVFFCQQKPTTTFKTFAICLQFSKGKCAFKWCLKHMLHISVVFNML